MRGFWECDTHFFVHGNVYPRRAVWRAAPYMLYWERFDRVAPHMSGKIMVCGAHQPEKRPAAQPGLRRLPGYFAYGGGWLSCLDIRSGQVWQANHAGRCVSSKIQGRLKVREKRASD